MRSKYERHNLLWMREPMGKIELAFHLDPIYKACTILITQARPLRLYQWLVLDHKLS